jgi:dTDP-4-amino-4,6-dideoxygalactose transaminase
MGLAHGGKPGMCPVTERVADELVRLPLFNDMSDDDTSVVIDAVRSFRA